MDKSFSLGNAHASMALASLNHDFIVNEAMVLVTTAFVSEAASTTKLTLKKENRKWKTEPLSRRSGIIREQFIQRALEGHELFSDRLELGNGVKALVNTVTIVTYLCLGGIKL